jgi:N-dimethylarginine dimethylaminohydrolase
MGNKSRYLLCPPDHYRVDYAINPWMGGIVDSKLALLEWLALEDAIIRSGAEVAVIDPHPDLPDMVFAANAGCVKDNHVVISNFKYVERRPEADEYARWFDENGFVVHRLPERLEFEGCGDAEFIDDLLIGGHGFRSDLLALEITAGVLQAVDLVPLRLVDPRFYHLDTCFRYVGGPDRIAFYYPGAFKTSDIPALEKQCTLIPIDESDAVQFVCNSIVIGNNVIMPKNNSSVSAKIIDVGFNVTQVAAGEFMKAGGSLRCLSLDLTK